MVELDALDVISQAEAILRDGQRRGFAYAPWVDSRYGFVNGVVIPVVTHLFLNSALPPVIEDAPQAGVEDYRALLAARRTPAEK